MSQIGRMTAGVLNPGAEPTPSLTEAQTPDPNSRDAAIAGKLQANYQLMLEKERAMGLDPKARKKLEGNRQSVNVQRAAAPLPAPRPVR